MKPRRPVTRVCLVLPAVPPSSGASSGAAEASSEHEGLADLMARDLAAHGVQVTRHVSPGPRDRGVRVDVAVWFADVEGRAPRPDAKEVPARVHVLICPGGDDFGAVNAARYDAVFVPTAGLEADVASALPRAQSHRAAVHPVALPFAPVSPRDVEKKARKLGDEPVVLVDVRDRFWVHIDRVLFQLALTKQALQVVLLCPAEDDARARVRDLANRSGLDAWLISGSDALTLAAPAVDLFIGRPSWTEVLWLAAHRVQVAFLGGEGAKAPALIRALRDADRVDEVSGVLQLAAYVDRRLEDAGGMKARGTLLEAALKGEARTFLETVGDIEPRPVAHRGGWEPVGPHAEHHDRPAANPIVEARVSPAGGEAKDRGAAIEDALDELKARLAAGDGESDENAGSPQNKGEGAP